MFKKVIAAMALTAAASSAMALPVGSQAGAIQALEYFGVTPVEAQAIGELQYEIGHQANQIRELSRAQTRVDIYTDRVDTLNATIATKSRALQFNQQLKDTRPQGAPVWSRADWQNWDRNRWFVMAEFGTSANVWAEVDRLTAELADAQADLTHDEDALEYYQGELEAQQAAVDSIANRNVYACGGVVFNGDGSISKFATGC